MINKLITTTILFVGFLINANGQDLTKLGIPEELGKQVLIAFKSNNIELFKSLFITEPKHELILNKMQASDSLKFLYREQGNANIRYLHKQAKQNFENILTIAKENNIDWKTAEIIEVKSSPRGNEEIERADIIIFAKSEGNNFVLILPNCLKSDFWYIMNRVEMKISK
jgi:hypothetical protein